MEVERVVTCDVPNLIKLILEVFLCPVLFVAHTRLWTFNKDVTLSLLPRRDVEISAINY